MYNEPNSYSTKKEMYEALIKAAPFLFEGIKNNITNLSNASAQLKVFLKQSINWVGFYMFENNELLLGPFQGLPACTSIPLGKGVCGTCAMEKRTIIVPNVHEFKGHIACDSASNSEIVIPIIKDNHLYALLDIDSPFYNTFDETDQYYLQCYVEILKNHLQIG